MTRAPIRGVGLGVVLALLAPAARAEGPPARSFVLNHLRGVVPDIGADQALDWSVYDVHQRVASTFRTGRVLLLGDAPYYARFGFSTLKTTELSLPGPFERERLLGLELRDGALDGACGMIRRTGAAAQPRLAAKPPKLAPHAA